MDRVSARQRTPSGTDSGECANGCHGIFLRGHRPDRSRHSDRSDMDVQKNDRMGHGLAQGAKWCGGEAEEAGQAIVEEGLND